jgi:hypothetical protein
VLEPTTRQNLAVKTIRHHGTHLKQQAQRSLLQAFVLITSPDPDPPVTPTTLTRVVNLRSDRRLSHPTHARTEIQSVHLHSTGKSPEFV